MKYKNTLKACVDLHRPCGGGNECSILLLVLVDDCCW